MKYRKKPVVINAIQFHGTWTCKTVIENFMNRELVCNMNGTNRPEELIIPTLEGEHIAKKGDYIIMGVKGEFYPCKPDIFEMTYEPA